MEKRKTLFLLLLFAIPFFVQSQQHQHIQHDHDTHGHTHLHKDLTQYVDYVASKTNKDHFHDHDHDLWHYYLSKAHPNVETLEQYFDAAANEFGVPAELLKAIGQVESNWTQIGPSIDRGWGIMHLVQNDFCNTLGEAAILIDVSEEELRESPYQNIRAGAALLAKYAGEEVVGSTKLSAWFEACKRFSGLSHASFQTMQAQTYFNKIRSGNTSKTVWGETIQLQVQPNLNVPQLKEKISHPQRSTSDYAPAIGQFTSCNFSTGRTSSIDTWVNHWIGVGTYAGAISWFQNCSAGASAHFVIRSSDGEITQVVEVANTAWHAGASGFNNNQRSIGVEHEATAANPGLWNSTPMLNASATMACYFAGQYNIPPVRALPGIREHNEMPGTNTSCAGNIPWTDWMNIFDACINGNPISLDCTNAVALTCGVSYSGAASTAASNVTTYGCNNWTETGPERVHTIVSSGSGTLTAQLSNYTGDLDVYILNSCDPNDCVGMVGSDNATYTNAIAGQTYYIVVDADDGSGGAYDLLVTCPTGSPTGLDCTNAVALTCGQTYSGAASTAASQVGSYACNTWTEAGPERVHTIVAPANGTLSAQLSNYTGDLDVYILGSCDPNDCLGTVGSDFANYTNAIAGQTYYIVVDADDGSGSAYDIVITCPQPVLDCSNAVALTCGVPYSGTASTASSNIDTYACNTWSETGPERVHTIVPSISGTITAQLSNYTGDLDVYILGSCDANDCLGTVGSDNATYTNAVAGQTYYIVVDADDGSGSAYDIVVTCPQPVLDCSNAVALACGVTYSGTASTASSNIDTYACNTWSETGPERVHTIVPSISGTITAQLSNYTGDLDVYILGSCDANDCLGTVGSDFATYTNAVAGQTYYIVVDADDGSGGAYDIVVTCPQPVLDCSNAVALTCGVTYSGTASTASSNIDTYACNTWSETGPERVHTIVPSISGTITAQLSNYTGDLDVYILGSCDPDDCLGTVGSDFATYTNAIAGQTYYIVVDADDGSGGAYDIIVTCPQPPPTGLDCSNAIALTCGVLYSGAASSSSSNEELYSCIAWNEPGPEQVHTIEAPTNGTITATLSNLTGDLDVFILDSCDANDCLSAGDLVASFTDALAGQTYYIVVDGFDGSGGAYDIIVDCPNSCQNDVVLDGIYTGNEVHQASLTINSAGIITSGAVIDIHAGDNIQLNAGFCIEAGAEVDIYIDDCQ